MDAKECYKKNVLVKVGRWMSDAEFRQMITTGRVVESAAGGVTHVIVPADPSGYRNALPGDQYVEFEVDDSRLVAPNPPSGFGVIWGPNSIFGKKTGVTDMPVAVNPRRSP
jgi:hypothetical protein